MIVVFADNENAGFGHLSRLPYWLPFPPPFLEKAVHEEKQNEKCGREGRKEPLKETWPHLRKAKKVFVYYLSCSIGISVCQCL